MICLFFTHEIKLKNNFSRQNSSIENSYTCYCYHRNLHKKIICKLATLRQNNSAASLLDNFQFLSSFGKDLLSGGAWLQVLWIIWHREHMCQCIHFRSHSCWHFLGIQNKWIFGKYPYLYRNNTFGDDFCIFRAVRNREKPVNKLINKVKQLSH